MPHRAVKSEGWQPERPVVEEPSVTCVAFSAFHVAAMSLKTSQVTSAHELCRHRHLA